MLIALRMWTVRQWMAAVIGAVASALVLGIPTVLIPNSFFSREIPPTAWSYPVWILTSILMGLLIATYISPTPKGPKAEQSTPSMMDDDDAPIDRGSRFGVVGGALAWFAIGCPVCNKIVLIALGTSGAMTWFAPVQPFLAGIALVLSAVALAIRLRGQVSCPTKSSATNLPAEQNSASTISP